MKTTEKVMALITAATIPGAFVAVKYFIVPDPWSNDGLLWMLAIVILANIVFLGASLALVKLFSSKKEAQGATEVDVQEMRQAEDASPAFIAEMPFIDPENFCGTFPNAPLPPNADKESLLEFGETVRAKGFDRFAHLFRCKGLNLDIAYLFVMPESRKDEPKIKFEFCGKEYKWKSRWERLHEYLESRRFRKIPDVVIPERIISNAELS